MVLKLENSICYMTRKQVVGSYVDSYPVSQQNDQKLIFAQPFLPCWLYFSYIH